MPVELQGDFLILFWLFPIHFLRTKHLLFIYYFSFKYVHLSLSLNNADAINDVSRAQQRWLMPFPSSPKRLHLPNENTPQIYFFSFSLQHCFESEK